jgi:magnesium-protoporphyrin IX monomethyl ester (oxidative) cyclase
MLHKAMGLESTDYDYTVFRITSEISKQVFPITLDIDHPAFRAGLDRLVRAQNGINAGKARGGVIGRLEQARWAVVGAATFARLMLLPVNHHALPQQVRTAPAW